MHTSAGNQAAPHWVKLTRAGNLFTGYQSEDGITWTPFASAQVAMAANVSVGVAVTSHNNGVLTTAVMDNVTFSPLGNDEPVAPSVFPDFYETGINVTLNVAAPGIRANDFDLNYDGIAVSVVEPPANGTLTLEPSGAVLYVPHADFSGFDRFTYTATDDSESALTSEPTTVDILVADHYGSGSITREWWNNINGNTLTSLTSHPDYPYDPHGQSQLPSFEGPLNWGKCYASRIRGYIIPPVSGTYTFWLSSADYGRLSLSPDMDPDKAVVISSVNGRTQYRQYNRYPQQQSQPIELVGGQKYYIEALQKQEGGGDHVTAFFSYGAKAREIISGRDLSPFDPHAVPKAPIAQPQSYETPVNTPLNIAAPGLLLNARDPNGDAIHAVIVSQPQSGTVELDSNGQFCYTPQNDFRGEVSFTYLATDGVLSSPPQTVSITVINHYGSGSISHQWWLNIGGTAVSDLTSAANYPNTPDGEGELTRFDGPRNWANNYGARVRGYVHATCSGAHTFYISGDDNCQVWLSDSANPADKKLLAYVPGRSAYHQFNKYAAQKSAPVHLEEGRKYYIEALWKESGGSDHLSIAWEADAVSFRIIPGADLSPFDQPVVAKSDQYATGLGETLTVSAAEGVLANDKISGAGWVAELVQNAAHGTAAVNADGSLNYSASGSFEGTDYFTYRLSNGTLFSNITTVRVVVNGLVAHWKLDETTGLTAYDSAADYDATLTKFTGNDAQWQPGSVDGALDFDGVDDHLQAPAFEIGGAFAVAAWVKYDSFNKRSRIIDFGNGASSDNIVLANHNSTNSLGWHIFRGGNSRYMTIPNFWPVGQWVHVVAQVDEAGVMSVYRNGVLAAVKTDGYVPRTMLRSKQYIGRSNWSHDAFFNGQIDDLKIYNRTLDMDEVARLNSIEFKIITPAESAVSPAFVEGMTLPSTTSVQITVDKDPPVAALMLDRTAWVADNTHAPLGITLWDKKPTTIEVTAVCAAGPKTLTQSITWVPTNIISSISVTVRKGDSLLLTSTLAGNTIQLDTDDDGEYDIHGAMGHAFPVQFNTPGVCEVHAFVDKTYIGTATVHVMDIDFNGPTACEINYKRTKDIFVTGDLEKAFFCGTGGLAVSEKEILATGGKRLYLSPGNSGTPKLIARIGTPAGPIIGIQEVDEFTFGSQATRRIYVLEEFEDAAMLVETNLQMMPLLPEVEFRLHIFVSGITFDDSTLDKTLYSNNMTLGEGGMGLHPYRIIALPTINTGPCHTIKAYQNGVQIGD